jgi:hypothetical protein
MTALTLTPTTPAGTDTDFSAGLTPAIRQCRSWVISGQTIAGQNPLLSAINGHKSAPLLSHGRIHPPTATSFAAIPTLLFWSYHLKKHLVYGSNLGSVHETDYFCGGDRRVIFCPAI